VGNDLTKIKQFTRHLGGSNLGFMDGHAKWFAAGEIAANSPWCDRNGNSGGWDRPLAQSLPCPAMN
jgi:prepilin-type processing-associated H-X9-DG protein